MNFIIVLCVVPAYLQDGRLSRQFRGTACMAEEKSIRVPRRCSVSTSYIRPRYGKLKRRAISVAAI